MTDFAAYVFYVNRPDLFERSVNAFPDLIPELTVVDNSETGSSFSGIKAFHPPVPLSYTQSMNWILKDALSKGVDFILHFHSDAFCSNPEAVSQLLAAVRGYRDSGRKWGCAWTFYDTLWAINPKAVHEVGGWDTNFWAYFCDNDMRRRLETAGWECIDTHIEGVNHEGSTTINSDKKLKFMTGVTFPLHRQYYVQKWGGEPGCEKFTRAFNGAMERMS